MEIDLLSEEEKEGNLIKIYPRSNELIRPAVANIDQAFVIFAASDPKPNFSLLDRFLLSMEVHDIPSVIIFNKRDLATEEELQHLYDIYQSGGYQVLLTSAAKLEGIDEMRGLLKGKTTAVAGPSGVGKSSLTNLMQSEVYMETGEISQKLGRGRHTTRHSQIIPVGEDSYIMDTPGFSSMDVENVEKEELQNYFPEFAPYQGECRFQGCAHVHEPGCAVKQALDEQKIHPMRYENYVMFYEELKEKEKRRY